MRKYIVLVFSFILIISIYTFNRPNQLSITFCDVGQGDATLLSVGSIQMLIDTGQNEKVFTCLENNMPFWDKKIEYLILTHMDSDHIGGAAQVVDAFNIDFLFINPSNKKTSDFRLLETAVLRKSDTQMRLISTFVGQNIRVTDGLKATLIGPDYDFSQVESIKMPFSESILSDTIANSRQIIYEENIENNLSIALKVQFKDVVIILPGDLEKKGELAMMASGSLNNSTVLKAGHHGSKSSSIPGFVGMLQPEITIVSSGENNAYNHPNPQVIDMFSRMGVRIYQTKLSGELNFVSDGNQIWEI